MTLRPYIFTLGLLLLAQPALADDKDTLSWDLDVAPTVGETVNGEVGCRPNPYALYRRGCGAPELNLNLESEGPRLTLLDRVALFVYRYKDLNLNTEIQPNTKLKFTMSLANLYEQEAKARLELRIRF